MKLGEVLAAVGFAGCLKVKFNTFSFSVLHIIDFSLVTHLGSPPE